MIARGEGEHRCGVEVRGRSADREVGDRQSGRAAPAEEDEKSRHRGEDDRGVPVVASGRAERRDEQVDERRCQADEGGRLGGRRDGAAVGCAREVTRKSQRHAHPLNRVRAQTLRIIPPDRRHVYPGKGFLYPSWRDPMSSQNRVGCASIADRATPGASSFGFARPVTAVRRRSPSASRVVPSAVDRTPPVSGSS